MTASFNNDTPAITAAKAATRNEARQRRVGCDPTGAGLAVMAHLLAEPTLRNAHAIGGFWPLPEEIDLRPLLRALHERGQRVVLPVTGPRGHPLIFHEWQPEAPLLDGPFGTRHPDGAKRVPDLLLVPLLGFDAQGMRLGYGGGYYDRTIAALPEVPRYGCAFAAQGFDRLPIGPHDAPLDAIATEEGIRRFPREGRGTPR